MAKTSYGSTSRLKSIELGDLEGIGRAMLQDFELLGVKSVAQLARRDPDRLYEDLCEKTGTRQDPCVLDTMRCAVAQARDPELPAEQRKWWWWSRARKAGQAGPGTDRTARPSPKANG